MSERPIVFGAPMVRALLDGRKTQTRRVLKPQLGSKIASAFEVFPGKWRFFDENGYRAHQVLSLPYAPGDWLWVREAFAKVGDMEDDIHARPDLRIQAYYRADAVDPERQKWRPSIHMPRWASRLTLTVTDVRVQRLQEISEADAIAEGVDAVTMADVPRQAALSRRSDFAALWNSIHGDTAWDANPWVAAISFTVHRGNIDRMPPTPTPNRRMTDE